jgi:hypothetical protein
MPLKLFLAAAGLAAVVVGLLLPTPGRRETEAKAESQMSTLDVGPG